MMERTFALQNRAYTKQRVNLIFSLEFQQTPSKWCGRSAENMCEKAEEKWLCGVHLAAPSQWDFPIDVPQLQ
jgi:hypothetical protein